MSYAMDPLAVCLALGAHDVRFVLIGGIAAHLWSSPVTMRVTEVCYDRSPDQLDALVAALTELRATECEPAPEAPLRLDAQTLAQRDSFLLSTTAGPLHCVGTPAGTRGYADLSATARAFDIDGRRVLVASLDDLMRMRRATDRPIDRIELEILGDLARRERHPPTSES